ncbi:putative acetyltransferase [Stieleria neptunia]|uniref:Putative acetyltransferase n=1 Tax=Stieleria neptunia TaxID=2527979 RepID=A0A518HWA0_9BACT|nr:GNAT family N-acetyltransferase [Stieleria neptunia]QDV45126.1 putative acetyltransferase [Stieleria neptunia]
MESSRAPQSIRYTISQATGADILEHLQACSGQFRPPLAERVDLPTYAEKLFNHSVTFEAWHASKLIGLVASYVNQQTQPPSAFVSNVSVMTEYRSQGIARRLMCRCHDDVKQRGVQTIALDVSAENVPAIGLYSKLGYLRFDKDGANVVMQLNLGIDG